MARREVVEVTCDRCSRVETQPKDEIPKEMGGAGGDAFDARVWIPDKKKATTVRFDDLCRRCRRAVINYFNSIAKISDEEKEAKNGASGDSVS